MRKIILTWIALCAALVGAWLGPAIDIPHFKAAHIERLLVTPAHAQLMMTGAGAGAPGGLPPAGNLLAFGQSNQQSNTGSATVSYGTLSYGGSSCTREVIAVTNAANADLTVVSVAVGGVTPNASLVSSAKQTSNDQDVEVWETTAGLSGSSGAVQVIFSGIIPSSGGYYGSYVALYCLTTTTPTANDGENATTGGTSISTNVNVPSGGACVGVMQTPNGGGLSLSFASATTDDTNDSNSTLIVGHCTTVGSPLNFVGNSASGSITLLMAVASWGP